MKCPNCLDVIDRPRNSCLFEAFFAMLVIRGHDEKTVRARFAAYGAVGAGVSHGKNMDALWDAVIGPAIDQLEVYLRLPTLIEYEGDA